MTERRIDKFLITQDATIRDVMACIDKNAKGIALVIDGEGRLAATLTDGDIRRAILSGIDLARPVAALLASQPEAKRSTHPVTAPVGTPEGVLMNLMADKTLRHVPLVDQEGRVVDIAMMAEMVKHEALPLQAVIMAGGFGTRLYPLTEKVPKPMLPVGDKPLLELLINQLRTAGIHQVNLATHYRSDVISDYFGDGKAFGVDINYVEEDQPLGTAGALTLLEQPDEPLLIINGDILTRVDFRAMLDFHRDHDADMTIGVREYEVALPFGVVESDGGHQVSRITEKPTYKYFVSAGMYLLGPHLVQLIEEGQRCDMPELITRLVADKRRVISFPIHEYWRDIGQIDDYENALADVQDDKV